MISPSRHGGQGGIHLQDPPQLDDASAITPYEEEHNRRKRALYDEVQKALLKSGFLEAAQLRSLFIGEVCDQEGSVGKRRDLLRAHCKRHLPEEDRELRRSARNVGKVTVTAEAQAPLRTESIG
jgi:hypothetical protein